MKKSIISSVLVASTLLSSIPTLNSGHVAHADSMSPLTTKGKEIQKDGHNYRLKGVNAGNVFTTEQWLGGLGSAKHKDYKSINDEMDGKYGAKKTHQLLDKYTENRWEDKDFKNLKDMGMNTIRLPINYINLTNYKAGMAPKDLKMRKEPFKAM
ncbi:glycoside hydrolase family 5 protein, partial [Staphylococcus epidermidis]